MGGFITFLVLVAGALAATAVAVVGLVGLFVWLAGGKNADATEAWPPPDER